MLIGLLKCTEICYNSLNYFLERIDEALQNYGIQTEWIDKIDESVLCRRWDAVIGINNDIISIRLDEGDYVFDVLDWNVFEILVDAPYVHHCILESHPNNLHLVVLDEGHIKYCQKYYSPFKSVSMACLLGPVTDGKKYEEREIDVLFSGTLPDIDKFKQKALDECTEEWGELFFESIVETSIHNPNVSMECVMEAVLRMNGVEYTEEAFAKLMNYFGVYAELYLRGYYREKIITTLIEAGIHVHIVGDGWERLYPQCPPNLIIQKGVAFSEVAEMIANSKIVLNVMPWFKDGIHDRIPAALMNGAVCVTDGSSYINSHFVNDEDLVIFDLGEINKLPIRIKAILEDDEKAKKIAERGKEKAIAEYSWYKIVEENILRYLV